MKQRLESKMLHTVTLAENNVQWIKEGKEILVNGRMFDVKRSEHSGNDKIIFTGLYDDEETLLVNQVKKNQQNDSNTGSKLLAQFFQLLQATNNSVSGEIFFFSFSNNNYFPGQEHRPTSQFIAILTPPPQV
jgi:ASC-1-like (ASCH) protein